ncbi:unnamed protein product [Linum tenue]|uniref:BOI-related E3 ubiquitin-protein ligase 3 n=1 Tax=Linum tenue TaxID=586396 RepID=A0AAV0RIR0_9ROSI|nr:unnamed protein product [Linum tenue]
MAIQAQFYGSQEWPAVENGFIAAGGGFVNNNSCFLINNLEQKQHQFYNSNLQQQQQQSNGGNLINNNNNAFFVSKIEEEKPAPSSSAGFPIIPSTTNDSRVNPGLNSMAAYEQKQNQEIDQYIRAQNERLRQMLQEQRNQQLSLLLKTIESRAAALLRQKDEEIARAAKRTTELETFLRRLEMENQAWQRAAKEKEAIAVSLGHTLAQVRENPSLMMTNNNINADDAESSCCEKEGGKATATATRKSGGNGVVLCKSCETRGACVLFLPCRHLCSCSGCDAFLDRCPLCQAPKKATIEALMG